MDACPGGAQTVQDVVTHIQENDCPAGHIVMGIMCDGTPVEAGAMAQALARPTSELGRLDVITNTKEALVTDAMVQASVTLENTENGCQRVAELINEGNSQEAIQLLGQCLSVWQQIHEAVAKSIVMLNLDMDTVTIREESLTVILSKPKETLLQMRTALESQDHVLLADILRYEFSEVTDRWHAVISMLRHKAEERLTKATTS